MRTTEHVFVILSTPQHVALLGICSCASAPLALREGLLGTSEPEFLARLASELPTTTTAPATRPGAVSPGRPDLPPVSADASKAANPWTCLATASDEPPHGSA